MTACPSLARLVVIGAAAILVLLIGLWAIQGAWQDEAAAQAVPRPVAPRGPLLPSEQATIDLFEKTRLSVVYITTQAQVVDRWTRNVFNIPPGTGSGFTWDDRGHIVTNYHVVADASGAQVRLSAGLAGRRQPRPRSRCSQDRRRQPPPLSVGSSENLRVGQTTFAIGNPFGLDWPLTTGIVSALDRSRPTEDGRSLFEHLIQTDAAINPGDSGGPLLDSAGHLIGVNTLIFSPRVDLRALGLLCPSIHVTRVVPQLIAAGKYVRPALGVEVDERLNQLIAQRLGVPGVVILRVTPGSSAESAGLRGSPIEANRAIVSGDIITAVEGTPVDSVPRLQSRLDDHQIGSTVRLTVLRDGRNTDVSVTLQADSSKSASAPLIPSPPYLHRAFTTSIVRGS
jgi:S1-C subfamily serine protease